MTATAPQTLSETTYWWDVQPHGTAAGTYVVSGTGTMEKVYEAGALASQKARIREIDRLSGEASHQCAVSSGQSADGARDVVVHDTRTLQNDTSIWWLGKLTSRVLITDFGGSLGLGTCQLPGSNLPSGYLCTPRAIPACPTVTPTAAAKTQTLDYFWNADSWWWFPAARTPGPRNHSRCDRSKYSVPI